MASEVFSPRVDHPAPSSLAPKLISRCHKTIATLDWWESEQVVVDKWKYLQTKFNLYTANEICRHCDEVEFRKKLGVIMEAWSN